MSAEYILPEPVEIGDHGVFATRFWVTGTGPIVLVLAHDQQGHQFRSRLDLQKSMFIDPMPFSSQEKLTEHLVRVVVAQQERLRSHRH